MLLLGELFLVFGLMRYTGRTPKWRPALDAILGLLLLLGMADLGQSQLPLAASSSCRWRTSASSRSAPGSPGRRVRPALAAVSDGRYFVFGVLVAAVRIVTLSMADAQAEDIFDRSLIQQVFSAPSRSASWPFDRLHPARQRTPARRTEYLATRDPMTGALNRRAFFARAEVEWRGRRARAATAVGDRLGHRFLQEGERHLRPPRRRSGDQDFAKRAGHMLRIRTSSPASVARSSSSCCRTPASGSATGCGARSQGDREEPRPRPTALHGQHRDRHRRRGHHRYRDADRRRRRGALQGKQGGRNRVEG